MSHPGKSFSKGHWAWVVSAGLLLAIFRFHAFSVPLETDECNYIYIAGRLLAGDRLYLDVWDHQPFGAFTLFAAAIALFGDAPHVFRWLAVSFSLITLALIYLCVHRLAGRCAALTAAILFAIVSSDPGTAGEGANREVFMSTLVVGAWCMLTLSSQGAWENKRPSACALMGAGALLGVGSTIKTVLAVHWLLLCAWVAWMARRRSSVNCGRRERAIRCTGILLSVGMFAAGPILIWGAAFAYFAATARVSEFVDAVFRFNLSYSDHVGPWWRRLAQFFTPERHPFIFDSAAPVWLAALPATCWLAYRWYVGRSPAAGLVVLLIVSSYLAVCLPGHFWPHYYYLMIPAMVMSIGVALGAGHSSRGTLAANSPDTAGSPSWRKPFAFSIHRFTRAMAAVLLLGTTLFTEYRTYLSQSSFGITVNRYNSRDFWGRALGEKIASVTNPSDKVFVFGNEAEVYYYAGRQCASRFTMCTGIKGGYAGTEERRRQLLDDLTRNPPRIIIVMLDIDPFPEWYEFLATHYGPAVGWDCHDRFSATCRGSDPEHVIMLVYARRDQPIPAINWNWDRREVGGWFPGETVDGARLD